MSEQPSGMLPDTPPAAVSRTPPTDVSQNSPNGGTHSPDQVRAHVSELPTAQPVEIQVINTGLGRYAVVGVASGQQSATPCTRETVNQYADRLRQEQDDEELAERAVLSQLEGTAARMLTEPTAPTAFPHWPNLRQLSDVYASYPAANDAAFGQLGLLGAAFPALDQVRLQQGYLENYLLQSLGVPRDVLLGRPAVTQPAQLQQLHDAGLISHRTLLEEHNMTTESGPPTPLPAEEQSQLTVNGYTATQGPADRIRGMSSNLTVYDDTAADMLTDVPLAVEIGNAVATDVAALLVAQAEARAGNDQERLRRETFYSQVFGNRSDIRDIGSFQCGSASALGDRHADSTALLAVPNLERRLFETRDHHATYALLLEICHHEYLRSPLESWTTDPPTGDEGNYELSLQRLVFYWHSFALNAGIMNAVRARSTIERADHRLVHAALRQRTQQLRRRITHLQAVYPEYNLSDYRWEPVFPNDGLDLFSASLTHIGCKATCPPELYYTYRDRHDRERVQNEIRFDLAVIERYARSLRGTISNIAFDVPAPPSDHVFTQDRIAWLERFASFLSNLHYWAAHFVNRIRHLIVAVLNDHRPGVDQIDRELNGWSPPGLLFSQRQQLTEARKQREPTTLDELDAMVALARETVREHYATPQTPPIQVDYATGPDQHTVAMVSQPTGVVAVDAAGNRGEQISITANNTWGPGYPQVIQVVAAEQPADAAQPTESAIQLLGLCGAHELNSDEQTAVLQLPTRVNVGLRCRAGREFAQTNLRPHERVLVTLARSRSAQPLNDEILQQLGWRLWSMLVMENNVRALGERPATGTLAFVRLVEYIWTRQSHALLGTRLREHLVDWDLRLRARLDALDMLLDSQLPDLYWVENDLQELGEHSLVLYMSCVPAVWTADRDDLRYFRDDLHVLVSWASYQQGVFFSPTTTVVEQLDMVDRTIRQRFSETPRSTDLLGTIRTPMVHRVVQDFLRNLRCTVEEAGFQTILRRDLDSNFGPPVV